MDYTIFSGYSSFYTSCMYCNFLPVPSSGIVVEFVQNYSFAEDAGVVQMCVLMSSSIECSLQSSVVITMEAESNSDGKNESKSICVLYIHPKATYDVPIMT